MDLRSRSRSNTPLLRRSQRIIENTSMETKKTIRSQKKRYITSDYSSEEGETIADNTKNLIREELAHSSAINGNGEVSALKLYREAGEYWNKFPKTDYTYSRHSKDRVELAPGVVVMPNMSRRLIRGGTTTLTTENGMIFDKEISTEENSFTINDKFGKRKLKPQVLFPTNNNNEGSNVRHVSTLRRFFEIIVVYLMKITTIILFPLFYVYDNVQMVFLNVGKVLHRMASRIMLWDTWILQKNVNNDRKLYSILSLCLLPLIIFGGFWVLYALITGLTSWVSTFSLNQQEQRVIPKEISDFNLKKEFFESELKTEKKFKYDEENFKNSLKNVEEGVAKKVLETISKENTKINEEIKNLKRGNVFLQEEIARMNRQINIDVKKCCRRSLLQVEHYVEKMLIDFFDFDQKSLNKNDLENWLKTIFVAKNDLETKIDVLTLDLKSGFDSAISHNLKMIMNEISVKIKKEITENLDKNRAISSSSSFNFIDEDQIKKIVMESLAIYDADKTGLVDYAMESAGGHIISTRCTQIYHPKTAVISIFGIPIWYPSNTPRTVITPGTNPGQCWAFQNFPGFLVIKLYGFVKISGFSMEHVSVKLAPNEKISSAPKDFEVYGLKHENDLDAILLGKYRFLNDGTSLQFFPIDGIDDVTFDLVELKVFSNHGNPNYTCLYRFRVHGELIEGSST